MSGSLQHGLSVPHKTVGLANKEVRLHPTQAPKMLVSQSAGAPTTEPQGWVAYEQQSFIPHSSGLEIRGQGVSTVAVW